MIEASRNVREVHELRDLRPHGVLETPSVSTEIAMPTRAGKQFDRCDTIGRGEHLSTEHALRFTAHDSFLLLVTHSAPVVAAKMTRRIASGEMSHTHLEGSRAYGDAARRMVSEADPRAALGTQTPAPSTAETAKTMTAFAKQLRLYC